MGQRLEDAIWYLATEYDHYQHGPLTRTKLMKLLYFADRNAARTTGHPVTGVWWTKYAAGPYAEQVLDAVSSLEAKNRVFEVKTECPGQGQIADYKPHPKTPVETTLSTDAKAMIDRALTDHAARSDDDLIKATYNLPEVTAVKKYGRIRFDTIATSDTDTVPASEE